MVKWDEFEPSDFEYDFDTDELAAHRVTFEEAIQVFDNDYRVLRNRATVIVIRYSELRMAAGA